MIVPPRTRVVVTAHGGIGDLRILGRVRDGWDVDNRVVSGDPSAATLRLNLDVGFGDVEVVREPA